MTKFLKSFFDKHPVPFNENVEMTVEDFRRLCGEFYHTDLRKHYRLQVAIQKFGAFCVPHFIKAGDYMLSLDCDGSLHFHDGTWLSLNVDQLDKIVISRTECGWVDMALYLKGPEPELHQRTFFSFCFVPANSAEVDAYWAAKEAIPA